MAVKVTYSSTGTNKPHKPVKPPKKESGGDEWAWLKVSLIIGAILALFIYFSNHYHPAPDVCQTNPNSQSCADAGQDVQDCTTGGEQC